MTRVLPVWPAWQSRTPRAAVVGLLACAALSVGASPSPQPPGAEPPGPAPGTSTEAPTATPAAPARVSDAYALAFRAQVPGGIALTSDPTSDSTSEVPDTTAQLPPGARILWEDGPVTVYRDETLPVRDLTVLRRTTPVAPHAPVDVTLSGFVTPPFGAVRAEVGAVLRDGERVDVRTADVSGAFTHNQRAACIDLRPFDPVRAPDVVTAAIDLLAPAFPLATVQVADTSGHDPAQPGDVLRYTVTHRNNGLDTAAATVATDPLPDGVTYLAGTLQTLDGPTPGPRTDQPGDDAGEYDATERTVRMRIGTGADAARGGVLRPGETAAFAFDVVIDPDAPETLVNAARIDGTAAALGTPFSQDGDPALTSLAVLPTAAPTDETSPATAPGAAQATANATDAATPRTDPQAAASATDGAGPVLTAFAAMIVVALAIVAAAVLRSRDAAAPRRRARHRR